MRKTGEGKTKKAARYAADAIYGLGTFIVCVLGGIALSHSNKVLFPDAMMPMQMWELAINWLAWGTIPMAAACLAVYQCNRIKDSVHSMRNGILIFLPGIICLGCMVFIAGVWIGGSIKAPGGF